MRSRTTRPPDATRLPLYQEALLHRQPMTADTERDAAARFRAGDRRAGEALVRTNLPFVISIAREYRQWGVPLEDLVQQGTLGLLKAALKFDPSFHCRLVTYASYWIRAEIREYVVRAHRVVRIGTTKGERKALRLYRRTGETDPERIAAATGMSLAQATRLVPMLAGRDLPLDDTPANGLAPIDRIASDAPSPEDRAAADEAGQRLSDAVGNALTTLPEREQTIVKRRWLDEEPATLEQLGTLFGISKERVRQLEARVRDRLRIRFAAMGNVACAG